MPRHRKNYQHHTYMQNQRSAQKHEEHGAKKKLKECIFSCNFDYNAPGAVLLPLLMITGTYAQSFQQGKFHKQQHSDNNYNEFQFTNSSNVNNTCPPPIALPPKVNQAVNVVPITPVVQNKMMESSCKTAIFLENHYDPSPVRTVNSLLPLLTKNGYKTFLFEEPKGMTINENIRKIDIGVKNFEKVVKTLDDPQYNKNYPTYNRDRAEYDNAAKSHRECLNLLKTIQKENLNYVAIDMDSKSRAQLDDESARVNPSLEQDFHIKQRDQFMVTSIVEACERYQSGQVLVVGLDHIMVVQKLIERGYNIISSYIVGVPERRDNPSPADSMLRSKDSAYMAEFGFSNTHIINFFDDPQDAELTMAGLTKELFEEKAE